MPKFKKIPVEVEAVRWTGDNMDDVISFCGAGTFDRDVGNNSLMLQQGDDGRNLRVNEGDWVIRGVEGELYPCTDSVFQKTYEAI